MKSDFIQLYEELSVINEQKYEAKRIISNPDELYHFTNPTPFYNIIDSNCLLKSTRANSEGEVLNAICFTTDEDYQIYNYPCCFQFSRQKLLADGYKLIQVDEFRDTEFANSESEERIYDDLKNVTKYLTTVYVYWNRIELVDSVNGICIADALYKEDGEHEDYSLKLTDFKKILDRLKTKGIEVVELGSPKPCKYFLDAHGKLCLKSEGPMTLLKALRTK